MKSMIAGRKVNGVEGFPAIVGQTAAPVDPNILYTVSFSEWGSFKPMHVRQLYKYLRGRRRVEP